MPEATIQLLAELGEAWNVTIGELLSEAVEQWYEALPYEDEVGEPDCQAWDITRQMRTE